MNKKKIKFFLIVVYNQLAAKQLHHIAVVLYAVVC
jgi:hypothetical protein